MTFNEFLKTHKVNGYALLDITGIHHLGDQEIKLLEDTWNAAITSSLNAVDAVEKSNIDENDVHVYIYEDIKKLLTSK